MTDPNALRALIERLEGLDGPDREVVNAFFKCFYPADWQDMSRYSYSGVCGGREYKDRVVKTVFPSMVCTDGLSMSVQGHMGAYSEPRDDFSEQYTSVEIMASNDADEALNAYADYDFGDGRRIFAYVPVEIVGQVIERHGGLCIAALRAHLAEQEK